MPKLGYSDLPVLNELAEQHVLHFDKIEELLQRHHLDGAVAERLLNVGVRRFRTLDRWGEKAEYERAVEEVLISAAGSQK